MATSRQLLTPTTNQTPAVVNVSTKELSGSSWVNRFPTSALVADLTPGFGACVSKFIAAIESAGGSVVISATYRPKERAYLMHYASAISKGSIEAGAVPAMAGVNIEWVHDTPEKSKAAATAMASAYSIVFPPALESRHTARAAIDMTISGVLQKTFVDGTGAEIVVKKNSDLHAVGASYGVHKLISDPPHWSDDGS